MVFNGITYLWDRWLKKLDENVASLPPKHIIIALTRQRAMAYCHREGIPPYGRNTYVISTPESVVGFRINPQDTVVRLNDAHCHRHYGEIRQNLYLASLRLPKPIDLDNWPVTYA